MRRNSTFFMGSGMASSGLPSAEELELLEPFRGQIPDRVFTEEFRLPETDGFGRNRSALLRAGELLEEAGIAYVFEDSGTMVLSDKLHGASARTEALQFVDNPNEASEFDFVAGVSVRHAACVGTVRYADYDFRRPRFPRFPALRRAFGFPALLAIPCPPRGARGQRAPV